MAYWVKSIGQYLPVSRSPACAVELSPRRSMKLAMECLQSIERMPVPQVNRRLCEDLASKLRLAVQVAQECNFDAMEPFQQTFQLLFRLAKGVEISTQVSCSDEWLQAAFTLTGVTEYVASLGFELGYCQIIIKEHLSCNVDHTENSALQLLLDGMLVELERVTLLASRDNGILLQRSKVLIEGRESDTRECQIATFLLGRLTVARSVSIPSSPGSASSLSSSSSTTSIPRVDYGSLKQQDVQGPLGTGSSGDVHRTRWLGELFAEKVFYGSDHRSFHNEVSILAGLSHSNVVPMFCYAMDDRKCSVVMELMEGDLFGLMDTRLRCFRTLQAPFSLPEAVDIIVQVAQGMKYLHGQRIVHRDLKSHNVLVKTFQGMCKCEDIEHVYAKVADFGLSKTKESSVTFSIQSWNAGTTRWMAPELIAPENS